MIRKLHKILRMKTILLLFFITTFYSQSHSQELTDSIAKIKIELLNREINILQRNQRNFYSQIDSLNKRTNQLSDSLRNAGAEISRLNNNIHIFHDSLHTVFSALKEDHISDIEALKSESQKDKKAVISFLAIIVVLISGLFVFFYYRNFRLEKFIAQETMKISVETDKQIQTLNSKWKKRWKRMKVFQDNVKMSLKKFRKKKK